MKPLQWWLGVAVIAASIAFHAAFPRYQVMALEAGIVVRVDRWSGTVESTPMADPSGGWAQWLEKIPR